MKIARLNRTILAAALIAVLSQMGAGATQCYLCHSAEYNQWSASPHGSTQAGPALGLALGHAGQTPTSVAQTEDCITCHAPTATWTSGGSDADALAYFFTTSNGVFTAATTPTNSGAWPHVECQSCHYVAAPHEFIPSSLALFDSRGSQYLFMTNSSQLCGQCHGDLRTPQSGQHLYNDWAASRHANTQTNVAAGLRQSHVGQTPHDLIYGTNAENCIACHSPSSVLVRGGDEALALENFFTTSNGGFTTNTLPVNSAQWPAIGCTDCHDPHSPGQMSYFNSTTREYQVMTNSSQLCGQCHGTLRFANSKYQLWDGWRGSKHANSQTDVVNALRQEHAGQTPDQVIHGTNGANCIACHSPTAVMANGGDEVQAMAHFFTTTNGLFTTGTASAHAGEWPGVSCTSCHDPHTPGQLAYFDSSTKSYQAMTNSTQLCGQCHGDLRFADSKYKTYNILVGKGGIGVPEQQLMGGVACTECHMHRSDEEGSNSRTLAGHSWAISVPEPDGTSTISCLACHTQATPDLANLIIDGWKAEFQDLEATTSNNVRRAAAALQGTQNASAQAALAEAQYNLTYAQSDESGGFHNHPYLMSLLQAANTKASSIRWLDVRQHGHDIVISWIGAGTLQAADSITGPWHDVASASNPLVITPATQAQKQYYRLRQ